MCQSELRDVEKEKRKLAFEKAHEIRKFEIELYWKRATYFWAFIAFSFGAYIAVLSSDSNELVNRESYVFVITCIGLIFSFSWYLVNRASKHWQTNWEKIIDDLEDEFTGDLMKRHITNNNKWYQLTLSYGFYVSRINQIVSLFVTLVWFFLMCFSACQILRISLPGNWMFPIFSIVTIVFSVILIKWGKSGKPKEKVTFNRKQDREKLSEKSINQLL